MSGSDVLHRTSPAAAEALAAMRAVRDPSVTDEVRGDPRVIAFAEQFGVDVTGIDDDLRAGFAEASGAALFPVTQRIYVEDMVPRLRAALDAVFGPGEWAEPASYDAESWPVLEEFMRQVARLDALDPTLTEIVRLRGARQHDCRVCRSRRSVAALDDGADEDIFDEIDRWETSSLDAPAKAALGLVDAMIWTPHALPGGVVDALRAHLTDAQIVEVALDVVRNAANKIAVSLGADAAAVTEGVELFLTDADGNLSVTGVRAG